MASTVPDLEYSETLSGTDYLARSFALVRSDIGAILRTLPLWVFPIIALIVWRVLQPDSFYAEAMTAHEAALAKATTGDLTFAQRLVAWLSETLSMIMMAGFATMRHRGVLRRTRAMQRSLAQSIPIYFGYWILGWIAYGILAVIAMLALLPFSRFIASNTLGTIIALALVSGLGLLILRGILVFPAIAIGDKDMTIERSFSLTGKNIWRMGGSTLLLFLTFGGIAYVWDRVAIPLLFHLGPMSGSLLGGLGAITIEFFGAAVFVTYISLLYAHFTGGKVPVPEGWDKA